MNFSSGRKIVCWQPWETDRTGLLRIKVLKRNYENGELKSELVCHAFDTDHSPDFENIDLLMSYIANLRQRLFLKGWHTGSQSQPLNEIKPVPAVYKVPM